jgi:hypothetical protein
MTQSKRKPTEFAINMCCSRYMLVQQEYLSHPSVSVFFGNDIPHIYFIIKRPRVSFIPDTFNLTDGFLEVDYKIQRKGITNKYHLKVRNNFGTKNATLICEYPHSVFAIIDNDSKEIITHGLVAALLNSAYHYLEDPSFLDCEILYIGQAFGKDGNRNAIDRLQSHSTLQLIYSEAIRKNLDDEIWLCLLSFEQANFTVFDGATEFSREELEKDDKTYKDTFWKINYEGLNEAQKINFTEAALIRYFQPQYNKEYKDSFPTKGHTSYSECYDLDINSVCFEMETSDSIFCKFYSSAVERNYLHMATFLLHSPEERRLFFDLF